MAASSSSSGSVGPSLPRSISSADLTQTERCREYIKKAWVEGQPPYTNYFNATPSFTLTIPTLREHSEKEFRQFVFKQIINYQVQDDLESTHTLNWCPGTTRMVPLYTIGDGNCLLHAASLGMWGLQDRDYTLRKAVHHAVVHGKENSLYDRWKSWRREELRQVMADLEPHQWEEEWQLVIQSASLDRSHGGGSLGYLDQFHIFTLCNVLRRPVFLYAPPKIHSCTEGDTLQQIDFHGIYLPLLWNSQHCIKNPLPIVFFNGHFSALSVIDDAKEYTQGSLLFPLMDCYGNDLPVRFLMHGESESSKKRGYLNITQIPPPLAETHYYIKRDVPCAKLELLEQPKYMKPLLSGFIKKCLDAYHSKKEPIYANQGPIYANQGDCRNRCGFVGSPMYDGYCSTCFKKQQQHREGSLREYSNSYQSGSDNYRYSNGRYSGNSGNSYQRGDDYRSDWRSAHATGGGGSRENDLEASTVLCSNNCNRVGFADYLGMCRECFESQKPSSSRSSSSHQHFPSHSNYSSQQHSTSSKAISAPLPPMKSEESRPCITPGCDFFGKAGTKFYCSECFKKKFPTESTNIGGTSPSNGDDMPMCSMCREFHANPEYRSLCSNCFKEKTKRDSSQENKRPIESPPTQRRNQSPSYSRNEQPHHSRDRELPNYYSSREHQSSTHDCDDLCLMCKKFHANPDYGELQVCSTCFMEKTKRETTQDKKRDRSPPTQRRNQHSSHSRDQQPYHSPNNTRDQQPYYNRDHSPNNARDQQPYYNRDNSPNNTRDQQPYYNRDHSPTNTRDQQPYYNRDNSPNNTRDQPLPHSGDNKECLMCRKFHANADYGDLQICSACFMEKTKKETTQEKKQPKASPPPIHYENNSFIHYRELPPTRRDCILCLSDILIGEINYICKEHAMKCREDMRRKRSLDKNQDMKRSPDPARNEFGHPPDPARNEFGSSSGPARNEFGRSPGPTRNEFRHFLDPTKDSHPSHDKRQYAKPCRTTGCLEYIDPRKSDYCDTCRERFSLYRNEHIYDEPNPPSDLPVINKRDSRPYTSSGSSGGLDRRASEPYLSSSQYDERREVGGAYTPPEQHRRDDRPHLSYPHGDSPHPLEGETPSLPKPKPRVPRNFSSNNT